MSANDILQHYRKFSQYTDPGLYRTRLGVLPNNIDELGRLIRQQIIPPVLLKIGNQYSNADMRYGDMEKVPWWRQREDDVFPTAVAILAELYRREEKGFIVTRQEKDKLVLSCRSIALLVAAVLKYQGIPARVRSGFASYILPRDGTHYDHWINQYWDSQEQRWITIDVDCCLEDLEFNPFDMPENTFGWAANTWLAVRKKNECWQKFYNAGGFYGLITIAWQLYYDFHCLMNNEIIYWTLRNQAV